jgi:hypothetical protein
MKKIPVSGGMVFALLLLALVPLATNGGIMSEKGLFLPREIGAWRAVESDQGYDRQTLYKYIDGGAELYLAYDFNKVFSRKYIGPGDGEIVLDVYGMGSSADAYGLFSSEREDAEAGIGQASEFGGGLLRFWQGNYFVSILAGGGDEKADSAVLEIGKAVAAAIPEVGAEPGLLKLLPPAGLDRRKIRYFHLPLQLDKYYFVANENILNLDRQTDCLLAEYPGKQGDPVIVLLVRYENEMKAEAARENFLKIYMPEARDGLAKMENGKWTMAGRENDLLKIVFEAPDAEQAAGLLAAVNDRENETRAEVKK